MTWIGGRMPPEGLGPASDEGVGRDEGARARGKMRAVPEEDEEFDMENTTTTEWDEWDVPGRDVPPGVSRATSDGSYYYASASGSGLRSRRSSVSVVTDTRTQGDEEYEMQMLRTTRPRTETPTEQVV
jgi:hypothetical protein